MGLDMYLSRQNKFEHMDFGDVNKLNDILFGLELTCPNAVAEMEKVGLVFTNGEHYKYKSTHEEVGYWRKANQIHNWFVENVQDGVDDCRNYEVTKEQLGTLLANCKTIIQSCKLINGTVNNGYSFDADGNKVYNTEDGKVMTNAEIAETLLPVSEGFFFGGTDYDQWYYEDIELTIEILTKVLDETNFESQIISYQSSW